MQEATVEIQVPNSILESIIDRNEIKRRVNEWLVFSLFVEERISSGKAASLLGISRIAFLKLLHERKIVYIDYSQEELAEELQMVEKLEIDLPE